MTETVKASVVIAARSVDMNFGGVKALSGVSIALTRGVTTGLIGPNGSGKSTLLNVLTGVYRQSAGSVEFEGQDISRKSPRSRALLGVGRTFQHPQVAASLTIRENIDVATRSRPQPAGALSTDEAIEMFGITPYRYALPATAPYGVLKLLEIARAVVRAPKVLLLDEPAAGLNHAERQELISSLRRYRDTSSTAVCLIEHDVDLVRNLCPELVVLETGQLIAQGPTGDVLQDERVRAAYLGDSAAKEETT